MKKNAKKKSGYFTHGEIALWCLSVTLILVSFILFDREKYMTLIASLIGVTSLIFNAKGNPIGQALTVVFSVLYGIISFRFAYYGEMITYLGMTMPMAIVALVAWLRHPYRGRRAEVEINRLRGGEIVFMLLLTAAVTFVFCVPSTRQILFPARYRSRQAFWRCILLSAGVRFTPLPMRRTTWF